MEALVNRLSNTARRCQDYVSTLRHWFATRLEDLGVSKTVRCDLLGHEPKDITDDYTHSTIEMRRRAVGLLCQTSSEKVLNFQAQSGKKSWQVVEK